MFEALKEFFQNSVALLSFFSIFAAGMIVVVFSLIFGGHDHGDLGHDVGHDVGHGDHDGDSQQGPGVFSFRGISLLMVGFGAVAFIVQYYWSMILVSCVAGLAFGWVFAAVCMAMYRILIRQQSNSMIKTEDAIGQVGEVVTTIPAGGLGEVRLMINGALMIKTASTTAGELIASGTLVKVIRVSGTSVLVERLTTA